MRWFSWRRAGVVAGLLLMIGCGLFWAARNRDRGDGLDLVGRDDVNKGADGNAQGGEAEDKYVMVGGIRRRASDVAASSRPKQKKEAAEEKRDYGKLPPVEPNANKQTAAVAAALSEGKNPERFSTLVRPAAFDFEAYKEDPQAYLDIVEPGRVFQSAQPGPGVPRLYTVSPPRQHITQGDTVPLRVAVPPGAPVTFTSFDAGAFSNQLTSITVQANGQGSAEAEFKATSGTIANVHILASSPVTSGQARFVVNILPADDAPAIADAR